MDGGGEKESAPDPMNDSRKSFHDRGIRLMPQRFRKNIGVEKISSFHHETFFPGEVFQIPESTSWQSSGSSAY